MKISYWRMSDTHFVHDKLIRIGYRVDNCYALMLNSVK